MTRELRRSTNQRQKWMRWSMLTICFRRKGTKPILQATVQECGRCRAISFERESNGQEFAAMPITVAGGTFGVYLG